VSDTDEPGSPLKERFVVAVNLTRPDFDPSVTLSVATRTAVPEYEKEPVGYLLDPLTANVNVSSEIIRVSVPAAGVAGVPLPPPHPSVTPATNAPNPKRIDRRVNILFFSPSRNLLTLAHRIARDTIKRTKVRCLSEVVTQNLLLILRISCLNQTKFDSKVY
jgi:hypothetical protein